MSSTSITLAGRAAADRHLFHDTCTITRETGHTTNTETGVITPTVITIYTGKCRITQRHGTGSRSEVGQASIVEVDYALQLPVSVTGTLTEDKVTVTASALDPDLAGRVFFLGGEFAKSHTTMRRIQLIQVTS